MTKQKTVGIRIPDNKICQMIIEGLGSPIITTSANLSGEEPSADAISISDLFGKNLDLIVDGGPLTVGTSTVISLIDDTPLVLREGLGDFSWI